MKTLKTELVEVNKNAEEYVKGTEIIINKINEFVKSNDLVIKTGYGFDASKNNGNYKETTIELDERRIKRYINNEGSKRTKRFKRHLNRLDKKMNVGSANRFLHFLYKYVYGLDERVSITFGKQYEKIMDARSKYVEARNKAIEMYELYKKEKGTYFIDRMNKNQVIN